MSDIFLSYSSSEKERVQPLVQYFEQKGWTVWWDRKIPPGKTFDEVIEDALNAAKCVVVIWSVESVKSNWIKTEADEGLRRGILVPILIDDVIIPFEFRRIQACKLTDLKRLSSNPELIELLNSISTLIGKPMGEELIKEDKAPLEEWEEKVLPEEKITIKKIEEPPKKEKAKFSPTIIVGILLLAWVIVSITSIHIDWVGSNLLFVIPLVTLVMYLFWPIKPWYASIAVLVLHGLNLILGYSDLDSWGIIIIIILLNAGIVYYICRKRMKFR